MSRRSEGVNIIRGMALAAAAATANGEAVNTEVEDDFDRERIKVRLIIGKRSALFVVNNIEVDHVQGDGNARMKVDRLIQEALSELVR